MTVPSPLLPTQTALSPTATAPGSGPTSIGAPSGSTAREVDPGDRIVAGGGDPDGAGAGVDPARLAADRDLFADHGLGRRVDRGDGVGAAVGDPDEAAGDGDAGRAAADQDRPPTRRVLRSMRRSEPVEALLPRAAAADRQPQRRRVRPMPRRIDLVALGVDRAEAGAVVVGDPDPAAAEDDRPGPTADVDASADGAAVGVDAEHRAGRRVGDPDRAGADRDPGDAGAEREGLPTGSPLAGSSRVRVPSGSLVTQIASAAGGDPQRRPADRDRGGDATPPPPPSRVTTSATSPAMSATAAPAHWTWRRLGRQPPRRSRAGPARRGRALGRGGEDPGRRRRSPLALAGGRDQRPGARRSGRPGPWRRRARSPRRGPPASPARCRLPCGRRAAIPVSAS